MGEGEALIQRRKMLLDKILKMNNEVEKIDQRLDFLGKAAAAERLDGYGFYPSRNKCLECKSACGHFRHYLIIYFSF
jgi:hypothetical protein